MSSDSDSDLKHKLLTETSKIAWKELQVFFAQGKTIHVSSQLDLLDVAMSISVDDSAQIQTWMDNGMIAIVSDDQARQWFNNDILVWSVVVRPWILVQNLKDAAEPV